MADNEQINIGLKLKEYFEQISLSQTDIANRLGVSQPAVSALLNGKPFGKNLAKKWGEEFGLKPNWLLTGEGEMLKNKESQPSINYNQVGVPYYDVDFIGGFEEVLNNQTINPEYFIDFKPYNTAKYWANVSGHSMEPNISHGDIIAIKEIENWVDFLPFGEIYGIVTDEFRTIKVVSKGDSPDTFTLIPLNKDPQYVQQEIPKRLIRKVFSVLGAVKKF